jgi:hypothetical protein
MIKNISHFTYFPTALWYHGRLGFWSVPALSSLLSISHSLACDPALAWWKHRVSSVWLHIFLASKSMWVVEVKTHSSWHLQDHWGDMVSESQEVEAKSGTESREGSGWDQEGKLLCTFTLCTQSKMFYCKLFRAPLKLNVIDSNFLFLHNKCITKSQLSDDQEVMY